MPHLHRFYTPGLQDATTETELPDEEAHHAARVLRVRSGDIVALFNGLGKEWRAEVVYVDKKRVNVAIRSARAIEAPRSLVSLCQATLNQDKALEEIIRRGTELGMQRLLLFPATRSERPAKIKDKWQRMAIESCKQCGRLWLPELAVADSLSGAIAITGTPRLLFTADHGHRPLREALAHGSTPALFIGPEGDFTPEEQIQLQDSGASPVSLGAYILRAEAAAITALTLTQYHLAELGPL